MTPTSRVVPVGGAGAPWYSMGGVQIHVGHVLDVLAQLPAESCQVVVTSPPYWGLRAYGTEPVVWGGDPECPHGWLETVRPGMTGGSAKVGLNGGHEWQDATMFGQIRAGTCLACGAYRCELGSEEIPDCLAWARGEAPCSTCFVCHLVTVFRAVRRVLHPTGTCWVNLGDSMSGSGKGGAATPDSPASDYGSSRLNGGAGVRPGEKVTQRMVAHRGLTLPGLGPKQLMMLPARVALALQADGWTLRQQLIWSKPNPMPESVTDRCTTAHEYIYLLAKKPTYFFDAEAIKEPQTDGSLARWAGAPHVVTGNKIDARDAEDRASAVGRMPAHILSNGRNRRSVWTIPTHAYPGAHFATFSPKLVEPCVLAGTSARGQCPRCGAPWRRVVERERGDDALATTPKKEALVASGQWNEPRRGQSGHPPGWRKMKPDHLAATWAQSCSCPPAEPVAQTVLDPFAGSGTSLWVARHHGRRAVGIELNESYAVLAADRLKQGVLGLELW